MARSIQTSLYGGVIFDEDSNEVVHLTASIAKDLWDVAEIAVQAMEAADGAHRVHLPEGIKFQSHKVKTMITGDVRTSFDGRTTHTHVKLSTEEHNAVLADIRKLVDAGLDPEASAEMLSRHYHLGVQHGVRAATAATAAGMPAGMTPQVMRLGRPK